MIEISLRIFIRHYDVHIFFERSIPKAHIPPEMAFTLGSHCERN